MQEKAGHIFLSSKCNRQTNVEKNQFVGEGQQTRLPPEPVHGLGSLTVGISQANPSGSARARKTCKDSQTADWVRWSGSWFMLQFHFEFIPEIVT